MIDLILDGGSCPVGIESTILDLSTDTPRLLRPGSITREQIELELGRAVDLPASDDPLVPRAAPTGGYALVDRAGRA